jgi:alpha-ketoglutarate-dependent taurine dioxygenase
MTDTAHRSPTSTPTGADPTLDVRPIAGHIGAEIHGVDIAQALDDATVAAIRAALLRFRVVFFRDQRLDHPSQIAFARRFGDLTYAHPHDEEPPDGFPEIYTVDTRRFEARYGKDSREARALSSRQRDRQYPHWHSDVTPAINPPWASILRAEVVPDVGGDTTWTSLVSAYEALSPPLQRFAEGLRAEHRYGVGYGANSPAARKRFEDNPLVAHHPVVRVHPETGEKALYVTPGFTSHILDVHPDESRRLLDLFFHELGQPEHTVRFRWRPGDVAFWDNRSTAHQAPRDLDDDVVERVLHRVTFIGDVPVGPDGRESDLVAGRRFEADAAIATG